MSQRTQKTNMMNQIDEVLNTHSPDSLLVREQLACLSQTPSKYFPPTQTLFPCDNRKFMLCLCLLICREQLVFILPKCLVYDDLFAIVGASSRLDVVFGGPPRQQKHITGPRKGNVMKGRGWCLVSARCRIT